MRTQNRRKDEIIVSRTFATHLQNAKLSAAIAQLALLAAAGFEPSPPCHAIDYAFYRDGLFRPGSTPVSVVLEPEIPAFEPANIAFFTEEALTNFESAHFTTH